MGFLTGRKTEKMQSLNFSIELTTKKLKIIAYLTKSQPKIPIVEYFNFRYILHILRKKSIN